MHFYTKIDTRGLLTQIGALHVPSGPRGLWLINVDLDKASFLLRYQDTINFLMFAKLGYLSS